MDGRAVCSEEWYTLATRTEQDKNKAKQVPEQKTRTEQGKNRTRQEQDKNKTRQEQGETPSLSLPPTVIITITIMTK